MPSPARLLIAGALLVAATPSLVIAAAPSPGVTATIETAAYEWSPVPIGGGGFVTGLVSTRTPNDVGIIYARTDVGGAYRWEDESGSWRQLFNASAMQVDDLGPSDYSVASIAVAPSDGDVVYAAVGYDFDPGDAGDELSRGGRLLRSVDGGSTWTASSQRFFVSGNQRFRVGTERLAVDPLDPRHVVFGSQREGLWRSSDGAETWTQIPVDRLPAGIDGDGLGPQAGVNFTLFADLGGRSRLFAGVAHHGVFASDDAGESWQLVTGLSEGEVPAAPALAGPQLIFSVNTPDADAARVVEVDLVSLIASDMAIPGQGTSWQVAVDPSDHQHLVLAGVAMRDGLLWTSRDGGASWTVHDLEITSPEIPWLQNVGIDQYMSTGRLMFDPVVNRRLWFGEGMAVWRTDDVEADSVVWQSASLGIEETVVSAIITPPDGTAIATVADRQGFRLDLSGAFPQSTLVDSTFATGASIDYSASSPGHIAWVGAEAHRGTDPGRTARGATSSDGGVTWTSMQGLNRDMFGGEVAVSATDAANVVWLPTAYESPAALSSDPIGVFTSADGGTSWTQVSVDGEDDTFHRLYSWYTRRALAADRVNGHFYLMSDEGRFFVSTDGGHTWTATAHAPPCLTADDCHVYGQVQAMPGVAELLWASVGAGGLYVSADAGRSPWTRVETIEEAHALSFGAPVVAGGDLAVYLYGRVAGDPQFGLWRTDDLGASWILVARHPMDLANQVTTIAGDLTVPGRVYVGFGGSGVALGDMTRAEGGASARSS